MGEFKPTAEREERAKRRESPLEAAERLRRTYGFELTEQGRKPVDQSVYDELGPPLSEANDRVRATETPSQTAARILRELGVSLAPNASTALPREVYQELEGDS